MSHRRLSRGFLWGGLAFSLLLGIGSASAATEPGSRSLEAVGAALQQGEITEEQALLYKLYVLLAPERLPARFNLGGGEPLRCGREIVQEVLQRIDTFSLPIRSEVEAILARPSLPDFIDSAHFRIHYATSGTHTIWGWPNTAYRDAVVQACENSWTFYHVTKDWQLPPSDGTAGGGSGLIDCYVQQLSGVYGYTEFESAVPGGWPNDYTAFFVIDNDYEGFDYPDRTLPMKVTVAHEYHHVVQMGYTLANGWWMENLSVFQEDEVYDSIDDNYQFLGLFLSQPYKKMYTANGGYEYGHFLWPTFIKENWDHQRLREIQTCSATTTIFTCFDNVFGAQSGNPTYAEAQADFNVWNFYTKAERDDGEHYIEGAAYQSTMLWDRQFSTYPQVDQHPSASRVPEQTACSVMRFTPEAGSFDNVLRITFNGHTCTGQVVLIAKLEGQQVFDEYYLALDANGDGTVEVPNWTDREYAHMIATFPRSCTGGSTFDYSFGADTHTPVDVAEHRALYTRRVVLDQNQPNPFASATRISYRLEQSGPVRLEIWDAAGRKVRNLITAEQPVGEYSVRWDRRDDLGRIVSPGIYFYQVTLGNDSRQRKMVVLED